MESSIDYDQSVRCHVCNPRSCAVDDKFTLIICGFRLRLTPPVRLLWARLLLSVISQHSEPVAVFPQSVMQPTTFTGRFAVDENGSLNREVTTLGARGRANTDFEPNFYGGFARESSVFWDILPKEGDVPGGCDQLAFTLHSSKAVKPELRVSLMLAVGAPNDMNEAYLAMTAVSLQIDEEDI